MTEEIGKDRHFKNTLIAKQILFVNTIGNVKKTVWGISILWSRCWGLNEFMYCLSHLKREEHGAWYP